MERLSTITKLKENRDVMLKRLFVKFLGVLEKKSQVLVKAMLEENPKLRPEARVIKMDLMSSSSVIVTNDNVMIKGLKLRTN